jgi:hypothetical protein
MPGFARFSPWDRIAASSSRTALQRLHDVLAVAVDRGVTIRFELHPGYMQRAEEDHGGRCCGVAEDAPAWSGFACPDHQTVVIDPNGSMGGCTRFVSQMLHEVGHVVMRSMSEDDVAEWEVWVALSLWGRSSNQTRDVIGYQQESGVVGPHVADARRRWRQDLEDAAEERRVRTTFREGRVRGEWRHCTPELLASGVDCATAPRQGCDCGVGGTHDHLVFAEELGRDWVTNVWEDA